MSEKSRGLLAVAVAALLLFSGCAAITGDGPVEFSADPVEVNDTALASTQYELANEQNATLERTVEVAGQERTVSITNHLKTYQKQNATSQDVGVLTVFSTPGAEIAGQPANPIARLSNDRLVSTVVEQSENNQLDDVNKVDEYQITVDGADSKVSKYEASTMIDDHEVDVYVHLTKVQMSGDTVVAVGVYPQTAGALGSDDMDTLMSGLQHESLDNTTE